MLNGRNHSAARKGLTVNGHGNNALTEADASALYGEYEQKLASELAELLKSGSTPRGATAAEALTSAPRPSIAPPPPAAVRSAVSPLVHLKALQQAAPGAQRAFVPAPPPDNDFSASGADPRDPLPFAWRHEPRPPQPSWLARQMKAGVLGLGAGLIVVLPAVAVLSGRLDSVLPGRKPPVAERAPRLYEVPITPPKAASVQTVAATTAAPEASSTPPSGPRINTVTTVRQPFGAPPKADPVETPAGVARSVGSVEAFPPASGDIGAKSPAPSAVVASATPAAATPVTPADEAADLLSLGLRLVTDGDIAGARTPLTRAANLGNGEAMLALGETYDPNMLAAWGALGVKSDAGAARLYYGRAAAAGLSKAKARLDALN